MAHARAEAQLGARAAEPRLRSLLGKNSGYHKEHNVCDDGSDLKTSSEKCFSDS